ncbi:unnamed protein product [Closterium sp. NIES-65]|nr:unnamed protein product [Closterium sp. NIES-65]
MALKLNEAYDTLMDNMRRASYKKEWRDAAVAEYVGFTGQPRSAWAAPEGQQQAIFVDEAACIGGALICFLITALPTPTPAPSHPLLSLGCRECVFAASRTFHFDAEAAVARVHTQWGDTLPAVQSAIDSCPVSCIHTVTRGDLPILEFLVQVSSEPTQPKSSPPLLPFHSLSYTFDSCRSHLNPLNPSSPLLPFHSRFTPFRTHLTSI